MTLDPATLLSTFRKEGGRDALLRALEAQDEDSWERMLLEAIESPTEQRPMRVNEVLSELDQRAQRWVRVPRVCASIASTTAFMLASMALRIGLTAASAAPDEDLGIYLNATIMGAMNVAAIGMAGAVFCVTVQMQARKVVKAQLAATDKLVERLESA